MIFWRKCSVYLIVLSQLLQLFYYFSPVVEFLLKELHEKKIYLLLYLFVLYIYYGFNNCKSAITIFLFINFMVIFLFQFLKKLFVAVFICFYTNT